MQNLKQDILDALHDATNLDNGRVSVPYFTELLDGILSEQCNIANVVRRSEQYCRHPDSCAFGYYHQIGNYYCSKCQKTGLQI